MPIIFGSPVWIIVPFEVATGTSDAACEIPGHGWVTAAHARDIITAPHSTWHTLPVDQHTGRALHSPSNAYHPSPALIDHIRALDGTCRAPGCEIPAHRCDIDHRQPWPTGPTHPDNLQALHRGHHNPKTAGLCTLTAGPDHAQTGALTWTTLAGREYITYPKNYREAIHADERHADTKGDHAQDEPNDAEHADDTDLTVDDAAPDTALEPEAEADPEVCAVKDDDPPPF